MSFDQAARDSQMDGTRRSMWGAGWGQTMELGEAPVAEPPVTEPPVRKSDMARILREVASTRDRPAGEMPSTSELAYGSIASNAVPAPALAVPRSPHRASDPASGTCGPATLHLDGTLPVAPSTQRSSEWSQRISASHRLAEEDAAAIVTTLIPAYRAARDARDTQAVAEIGGRLIASFSRKHGAANLIADLATFGVHSSYGKARDAHTRGETSDADYAVSKRHLVGRTAATAAVALLTGGAADKLVRGGAATVSTARAAAAGFTAGSIGATANLATTDAYNVFVSGEQDVFSSPEDYIKTALLGGALGAVGGVASNASSAIDGLSKRHRWENSSF